jgi:hypothetical protein
MIRVGNTLLLHFRLKTDHLKYFLNHLNLLNG